jgi:hypothetical protein
LGFLPFLATGLGPLHPRRSFRVEEARAGGHYLTASRDLPSDGASLALVDVAVAVAVNPAPQLADLLLLALASFRGLRFAHCPALGLVELAVTVLVELLALLSRLALATLATLLAVGVVTRSSSARLAALRTLACLTFAPADLPVAVDVEALLVIGHEGAGFARGIARGGSLREARRR